MSQTHMNQILRTLQIVFSAGSGAIVAAVLAISSLPAILNTPAQASFAKPPAEHELLACCTHEPVLVKALQALPGTPGEPALSWIMAQRVKIVFRNMATVHRQLKDFDAVSWLSADGRQVVFINEKHQNAAPQALAALIAHEALHNDAHNSIAEEVSLWQREADVWLSLRKSYDASAFEDTGLVHRLDVIAKHRVKGDLPTFVSQNPGYRGLPKHSPGY